VIPLRAFRYSAGSVLARPAAAGREDDLVIIGPDAKERFNFIQYEASHPDAGVGLSDNIVRLLETVSNSVQRKGKTGRSNDSFWDNEYGKLVRNAVDLLRLAKEDVTLDNIAEIITTARCPLSK